MTYKYFDTHPVGGSLGAEVSGLDLSEEQPADVRDELYKAWLEYQVLFFRDQELEPDHLQQIGGYFGEFEDLPFLTKVRDDSVVTILSYGGFEPAVNVPHIDVSYSETPSKGALLYAKDVPQAGGDTIWVSAYAAYETLSDPMQHLVEELTAIYPTLDRSFVDYFIKGGPKALGFVNNSVKHEPVVHSLVHVHPETGRKALFVDPLRMWSIREVTGEESRALIDFLHRHVSNPELQVRLHWKPGVLAIWDNRCTLHRRVDDIPEGATRDLHRVGLIQ